MNEEEGYFTKFLTAPQLMALEIRDPHFRKHVLIQIAIFCQALQRSAIKTDDYTISQTRVCHPPSPPLLLLILFLEITSCRS